MKLWFDEDLSPTLVQVATELGFMATCNRDRDLLGRKDPALRGTVQSEDYVFVTDNASDFRPMYARDDIHPGLIVMPGSVPRDRQQALARAVIDFIVKEATRAGDEPRDFTVNKLVEIDEHGACSVADLPTS